MNEIINNLVIDEVLYTTSRGTVYRFSGRNNINQGIKYSINRNHKTLPLITIQTAFSDFSNGIEINSTWYRNFNNHEYETRTCNLSVLRSLLSRLNS
jgi:hypothetical protein